MAESMLERAESCCTCNKRVSNSYINPEKPENSKENEGKSQLEEKEKPPKCFNRNKIVVSKYLLIIFGCYVILSFIMLVTIAIICGISIGSLRSIDSNNKGQIATVIQSISELKKEFDLSQSSTIQQMVGCLPIKNYKTQDEVRDPKQVLASSILFAGPIFWPSFSFGLFGLANTYISIPHLKIPLGMAGLEPLSATQVGLASTCVLGRGLHPGKRRT